MKKIIDYFKNLRKNTIYKIVGILLLIGIIIWMVVITDKVNGLLEKKESSNVNILNNNSKNNENKEPESVEDETEDITKVDIEEKVDLSATKKEPNTQVVVQKDEIVDFDKLTEVEENADVAVLAYFDETSDNLEDESLREKAKKNFITIVDFIFYEGKIKGYTFSELTNKAKLKVLQIALKIDNKIDDYFPDYKEEISSTTNRVYTNVKELIVTKYLEVTTKVCENDPDLCESAKQDFQDMKKSFSITWELIKNVVGSGASSIKTWYEIYSGK